MKLTLKDFRAAIPKIQSKLLPANYSQRATNVKVSTGAIASYKEPLHIESVDGYSTGRYRTIATYYNTRSGRRFMYSPYKINVVKGPVFNDVSNKIYFCNNNQLWVSNQDMLENVNYLAPFEGAGVTPSTALRASLYEMGSVGMYVLRHAKVLGKDLPPGGFDGSQPLPEEVIPEYKKKYAEARVYCAIYAREWKDGQLDLGTQKGVPGFTIHKYSQDLQTDVASMYRELEYGDTYSTVAVRDTDKVNVMIFDRAPDLRQRGINKVYIYRSAVSSTGESMFRLVCIFGVGDNPIQNPKVFRYNMGGINNFGWVYEDDVDAGSLYEEMMSTEWGVSPEMEDVVGLSNGILVGFKGFDANYSASYQPHAWPYNNRVTLDYEIVGIGSFEATAVLCTKANPVLLTIQDASSPIVRPIKDALPCLNKGSICSFSKGVIYSSTSGLILINQETPINLTDKFFTKDQWNDMNPASLIGGVVEDRYFGFFTSNTTVKGFTIDLRNLEEGVSYLDDRADDLYVDQEGTGLYILDKTTFNSYKLLRYDSDTFRRKTYIWKSKTFSSNEGLMTFAAARLDSDFSNGPITFNYFADKRLRYTRNVSSNTPFRLPSGFRNEQFEIEVSGTSPLYDVQMATSMGELTYE